MSDLGLAVKHLVELATKGSKKEQRGLGDAVRAVLTAWKPKDTAGVKAAMRAIGKGVIAAEEGRGKQILLLALGAVVESGAPPELAWPAISHDLRDILDRATKYTQQCLDACDEFHIPDAVRDAGPEISKKNPKGAEAWEALASRCLSAVACLSRSSQLRKKEQASGAIIEATKGLYELVEEVTFLSQIIRLIDDVPLLVIHPESRRGFRLAMNDCATNVEMYVLAMDAIVGDPAKGFIKGPRPGARALKVLHDPDHAPEKTPEVKVPWHTVAWIGLGPDGALPASVPDEHQNWVWLEGVPAEIPLFEGERVVLFTKPLMARTVEVEPAFEALYPRMKLKSKVSAPEVDRLLAKMGKAAVKEAAKYAARRALEEAAHLKEIEAFQRQAMARAKKQAKAKPAKRAGAKR